MQSLELSKILKIMLILTVICLLFHQTNLNYLVVEVRVNSFIIAVYFVK